jgi:uncharacterized membrane protein YcaP (DUF421 family)
VGLTSLLSVVVLFGLARLMGRRQIAQLDVFDYIIGITIGSIAAELAIEPEGMWEKVLAMVVYGGMAVLLNVATNKGRWAAKVINGDPLTVFDQGQFLKDNMARAKVDLGEVLSMLRVQGYFDLSQVQTAILETNGQLSVLPVTAHRPVTPQDMSLAPAQETVFTEFIMDGRVMGKNLKGAGFDGRWLQKQLKAQGYPGPEAVFLAQWDNQGKLSCYTVSCNTKQRPS